MHRIPLIALVVVYCAVAPARPAAAQEPVRETQVPVDTAGRVLEVTPELRRGTRLFLDVPDFQSARLFRQENGTLVLEVSWVEAGRLVRERSVLPPAAAEALRREVETALAAPDRAVPVSREGRGGLVWAATGLGLGFYGWAVPIALNIGDERGAVAAYLLTAASSFYLPYRLTRERSVTDAHRNLSLWGATRGALYGGTLGFALTNRGGVPNFEEDEDDEWRLRLALATAGSITGGVLGFKAVDWTEIDEGTADLWGALADFSTAAGFGTGYVLGLYDEEARVGPDGFPVNEEADLLPGNLLALGFAGAGLYGARSVGRREDYTVGDVHVLRSMGLVGAQALLPVANLVDRDEGKVHVAAAMLGAGPGLWLGNRLLRDQSFSGGDGLLVAAGHLAGGLLGAGLTYLVAPEGDREALIYFTTTAAGSAAGLAFTYRALSNRPFRSASAEPLGVQVSMNPAGLLPLMTRAIGATGAAGAVGAPGGAGAREGARRGQGGSSIRTPLVTVRW